MPVMLQVRNLPDDVHAKLKARAAEARMSLSDYVAQELAKLVRHKRTNAEIFAGARARAAELGELGFSTDEIVASIHEAREERDDQLEQAWLSMRRPSSKP